MGHVNDVKFRWSARLARSTHAVWVAVAYSRVDLREAFNLAMHSSGSTNGSSLAQHLVSFVGFVGLSTGGRGVVEQALQ